MGTAGDGFVLVGGDTYTIKYKKPDIFSTSLMYIRLLDDSAFFLIRMTKLEHSVF